MCKPRMLVVSKVLPFHRSSGQQQRVYYKLRALRRLFHVSFLTSVPKDQVSKVHENLREYCDDPIVLSSPYARNLFTRSFHRVVGELSSLHSGLKLSNYAIGHVEFAPLEVEKVINNDAYDLVIYEYWHAVDSVRVFQQRGIPCILDMHDILWRSLARQYKTRKCLPEWWKQRAVRKYRDQEESAWNRYDGLIAINAGEYRYVQSRVKSSSHLFYAPMGIDLGAWPYVWKPSSPARVVYYGGLGSPHNAQDALQCYKQIMPILWKRIPDVELWLVGNNPPNFLKALPQQDSRVVVTGFVESVQDILKTMAVLICPWSGTYGFRSRLVETMALGIPVVASPDAVYGMDLKEGQGIILEKEYSKMAEAVIDLLSKRETLEQQSHLARKQIEEKFSFESTYVRLANDLSLFLDTGKYDS